VLNIGSGEERSDYGKYDLRTESSDKEKEVSCLKKMKYPFVQAQRNI
jgi:hypothetical protein